MRKKSKKATRKESQNPGDKTQSLLDLAVAEQVALLAMKRVFLNKYTSCDPEQNMDLIWAGANHWSSRVKNNLKASQDPTEIRVQVTQDESLPSKQIGFSLINSMFTIYAQNS